MRSATIGMLLLMLAACTLTSPSPVPQTVTTGITAIPGTATQDARVTEIAERIIPPLASQIPVSCVGAPPVRLIVKERGRVTDENDETLNLRNGPGTNYDILLALNPRDEFFVLDGPTCGDSFAWFRVRHAEFTGWVAEGDREGYYVEPYLPG